MDIMCALTLSALVPGSGVFLVLGLFTNIPPFPLAFLGGALGLVGGIGTLLYLKREISAIQGWGE